MPRKVGEMIKLVEADGWYLVDVAPAHRAEHPEAGGYPMEDPMSGYVVVVERDEVGGFSTWSPDLPGCVAADRDYDECLRLMTEAVHLHLEGMQADGDPVPEPTAMTALVIPAA